MKTCNGCENMFHYTDLADRTKTLCICMHFKFDDAKNSMNNGKTMGWWNLDEPIPTPDWCPKEDEKNE